MQVRFDDTTITVDSVSRMFDTTNRNYTIQIMITNPTASEEDYINFVTEAKTITIITRSAEYTYEIDRTQNNIYSENYDGNGISNVTLSITVKPERLTSSTKDLFVK